MQILTEIDMSGDIILTAARDLLASQPSAEVLDAELAAQVRMAEATQAALRADISAMIADYRAWRRDLRCGRMAGASQPVNLKLMKQIRASFATYRLTQILLRDIREIALLDTVLPVRFTAKKQPALTIVPQVNPVPDMPVPANDSIDALLYEELEAKYGPVLAQKLYDDLKSQERADQQSAKPH